MLNRGFLVWNATVWWLVRAKHSYTSIRFIIHYYMNTLYYNTRNHDSGYYFLYRYRLIDFPAGHKLISNTRKLIS